jgi:prolyl 4-hydroxylase
VRRDTSPITEAIFQRAADVLKLPSTPLGDTANAELLQLAHYRPEQQADRHDWGVERGDASRHLTLLIYLNDPIAGGQSAFPKAIDEKTGKPIVLHPGRGSAILLYNALEDGNEDDRTLHAALPVVAGEEWLATYWISDFASDTQHRK